MIQTKAFTAPEMKIFNRFERQELSQFSTLSLQCKEVLSNFSCSSLPAQGCNYLSNSSVKAAKALKTKAFPFITLKHFSVFFFSMTPQIAESEVLKYCGLFVWTIGRKVRDGTEFTAACMLHVTENAL